MMGIHGSMLMAALLVIAAATDACAADDELAALKLEGIAPPAAKSAADWHASIEAGLGQSRAPAAGADDVARRMALVLDYQGRLATDVRAVFSDRLDIAAPALPGRHNAVNTLKEAYLSWQAGEGLLFDIGRINARNGVAQGYNPTDYLRDGALRTVVSADPRSLKENRLGSVMLRGQALWDSGAASLLVSPKLESQRSSAGFSADFGATNARERALLTISQRIGTLTPQWLLYAERGKTPQAGFNLSLLANDATVAYVEWSGGRSAMQSDDAFGIKGPRSFRQRASAGLTYSTEFKLTLTAELQHDGAAPTDAQWDALRRGAAPMYWSYRAWQEDRRELAARRRAFFYASWQDAGMPRLELNAMVNRSLADGSRLAWLELRYRLEQADLGLQWQHATGAPDSEFGAASPRTIWQAFVRRYF